MTTSSPLILSEAYRPSLQLLPPAIQTNTDTSSALVAWRHPQQLPADLGSIFCYQSIFKCLTHDGSFCSAARLNFSSPCCSFSLSLSEQHIHCGGSLAFLTRSKGLQVAEKTRLITSSGAAEGGDDTRRDESSGRGRGRIRGKRGVIERKEEEQKLCWAQEGGSRAGRKGKRRQVETRGSNYLHKCLCCAQPCVRSHAGPWTGRGGQG